MEIGALTDALSRAQEECRELRKARKQLEVRLSDGLCKPAANLLGLGSKLLNFAVLNIYVYR